MFLKCARRGQSDPLADRTAYNRSHAPQPAGGGGPGDARAHGASARQLVAPGGGGAGADGGALVRAASSPGGAAWSGGATGQMSSPRAGASTLANFNLDYMADEHVTEVIPHPPFPKLQTDDASVDIICYRQKLANLYFHPSPPQTPAR